MRGARLRKRSVTEPAAWLQLSVTSACAIPFRVAHILVESYKRCSATASLQGAAASQASHQGFNFILETGSVKHNNCHIAVRNLRI